MSFIFCISVKKVLCTIWGLKARTLKFVIPSNSVYVDYLILWRLGGTPVGNHNWCYETDSSPATRCTNHHVHWCLKLGECRGFMMEWCTETVRKHAIRYTKVSMICWSISASNLRYDIMQRIVFKNALWISIHQISIQYPQLRLYLV